MTIEPEIRLKNSVDGKPQVRVFASWASADYGQAHELWGLLGTALAVDAAYDFDVWSFDERLCVGEYWDDRIREALTEAHLGVFAMTPSFLASRYITHVELPAFVGGTAAPGGRAVPVLLKPIPEHANLLGLEHHQIFCHRRRGTARAFSKSGGAKDEWSLALAAEIHQIVDRYGTVGP